MSVAETRVDAITAWVVAGALDSIAIEMGHKLARMSYSSIIRESEDFGCVICDEQARQLCESSQSTPLQSGPIPGYVRGINRRLAELGEQWKPGDVVIHNHPYYGSSHQPDVCFCVPIFYEGELVGFSATTAHHLDLGALTPGSCGIVDATDAYAEGLLLNAVKVEEEGRRNEWVWRLLADNVRAPQLVIGDMEAQVAACKIGAERFCEVLDRYGVGMVKAACEDLMDYSERMLRREIEQLPDGTYTAEGRLDGYPNLGPEYADLPIKVAVTVDGSDLEVDLTGTAPQLDLPINMPFEGTVDIAILVTLRSILLDAARRDPVPTNSGLFRPIRITAPEGCLANPTFPAPTIARFCSGNMIADTLMRALAPLCPDRVSAGIGNLKVVAYSGLLADGRHWVYMDIQEGSYGGRQGKDGLDAVDTLYANTRNNPIEDIESHYPLRVVAYELVENCAGPGKWRGGLGTVREIEFLAPTGYSLEGDGNVAPPQGLFGGREGTPGAVVLNAGSEREEELPSKFPYRRSAAGERIRLVAPCGGGYGDPLERDGEAVREDVLDGYVSAEGARTDYGLKEV